jgi:hypothetical protein
MTKPPSLPDLFKSETARLEKLRVLEVKTVQGPPRREGRDSSARCEVMEDIQRLTRLIENCKAHHQ